MTDGWTESAAAWIASVGERGDWSREFVLDPAMMERVRGRGFRTALDVGCGEGRFCRMLAAEDIKPIGIDPTEALLTHARRLDPGGDYRTGRAETLDFPDQTFDLVISYLTFIDIPQIARGISEMARVLRSGGVLLIANHTSFFTAGPPQGWTRDAEGKARFFIDDYMAERADWVSWDGIRIENWHRPLSTYMSLLLSTGLELRYFAEPFPIGCDPAKAAHYGRVPLFLVMEWQKSASPELYAGA